MKTNITITRNLPFMSSIEEDTFRTYFDMMCTQPMYGVNTTLYYDEEHEVPELYQLLFNEAAEMMNIIDDPKEPDASKIFAIDELVSIAKTTLGFSKTLPELNDAELSVVLSDEFWREWNHAIYEREV